MMDELMRQSSGLKEGGRSRTGLRAWALRGSLAVALGVLAHGGAWAQDTICGIQASKCTSNDLFNSTSFKVDTTAPAGCVAGQIVNVPVSVVAAPANTNGNRYSIGVEYGVAGATCTTIPAQIPGPLTGFAGAVSGFSKINGDTVGDLPGQGSAGYINFTVPTLCQPDATGQIKLQPLLGFGTSNKDDSFASVAAAPTPKCYADTLTYIPSTITGKLAVKKTVIGGTGGTFPFTVSGGTVAPAPSGFNLTVAAGASGSQPVTVTLSSTGSTTFTITETPQANYALQAPTCRNVTTGAGLATTAVTNGVQVTMSAQAGGAYDVECTFTNEDNTPPPAGSLTVTKLVNDGGLFNLTASGAGVSGTATNIGNGGTLMVPSIAATTEVTITETAGSGTVLANYGSALTCTGATVRPNAAGTSGTFTMPSGAAVKCTFTNSRLTNTVTVKKALDPTTDSGHFDLTLNGVTVKTAAGHDAGSSAIDVAVGSNFTVTETPNSAYTSSLSCPGATQVSNTGASGSFTMPNAPVVCTFTNKRKTNDLTITKALVPTADTGKFNLQVNGVTKATDAGNNGTTGIVKVDVGSSVTVDELAGSSTVLANYDSKLVCSGGGVSVDVNASSGGFIMPDAAVNCTFTNTRKPQGLTVKKALFPVGDPGKFTLQVSGGATAAVANVGDGGSTGSVTVTAGQSVTVTEIAGTGTVLSNYASVLTCEGVNGIVEKAVTTDTFTMPDNAVTCTFSNTHKRTGISVSKTSSVAGALTPGGTVIYTVVVSNTGELAANNVPVKDVVPGGITGFSTWSCAPSTGSACTASGSGDINDTVNLLAGGSVTYTITATASSTLPAQVTNKVTVTPPTGTPCTANGVLADPCEATVSNPPQPPAPPPAAVAPIPTTSPEGLAALALMMVGVVGWAARRQRRGRK